MSVSLLCLFSFFAEVNDRKSKLGLNPSDLMNGKKINVHDNIKNTNNVLTKH